MEKTNVVVAPLGIKNRNGSEIAKFVHIQNPSKPVPVTIEFSELIIGSSNNFRKVENAIVADIKCDRFPANHVFRLGYSFDASSPIDITIFQLALLPLKKDPYLFL